MTFPPARESATVDEHLTLRMIEEEEDADDDDDGQRVRRPLPCTNDVSGLGAPPPPAVSLLIVGVR